MGCGCAEKKKKKQRQKRRGTIRFNAKKGKPLKAASRIRDMRRRLCAMCNEFVLDPEGKRTIEKLYGPYKGDHYCGDPNEPQTDTDPKRFGCGCKIDDRVLYETAVCPRGRWGPGKRIGANIIAYFNKPDGAVEKDLYDFIGPARCGRDGMIDCTGIGDTLVQGVVAQAVWKQKKAEGLRVRFITVDHRMDWARLATAGKMDVLDYGDPHRKRAMYAVHSAPIKAVEIDATCRLRGFCRQELIGMEHYLPAGATQDWDMKIPDDSRQKAAEFLRHPIREQRPIIAIAPWTNASVRQWPIRHWAQLAERLKKQGFAVCLLDPPKPKGKAVRSDAFPFPKFRSGNPFDVAAVVSKIDLLIGNDSGMPHLAGFVGTSAIAICGPTEGKVAFGGWPSVKSIQAPGECTGCLWFKDGGWKSWCGFGCELLNTLSPQTVIDRAVDIINTEFEKGAR